MATKYDDVPKRINALRNALKASGYKEVDQQHTLDGIAVDADEAEHQHYLMQHKDGRKAIVFSHKNFNATGAERFNVGVKHGGKKPEGRGSRWVGGFDD